MDSNDDVKHRDHSDRGSNDSVGSGSSFEELDMDQEGQEQEEVEEKEDGKEEGLPKGKNEGGEAVELVAEKKELLGEGEE